MDLDLDCLLVQRMRMGDERALDAFVTKYYPAILKYCRLHIDDYGYAEDMAQETFARFFRTLKQYRHYGKVANYLYVIAANVCRDYFRKDGRRTVREVSYSQWEDSAETTAKSAEAPPSTAGAEQETLLRLSIREGLMHLPESQREAIVLYYYQGYKLREIAGLTGVPLSTVKTRLYAGTEKLKQYLKEEGGIL